jgi:hypothetical protein
MNRIVHNREKFKDGFTIIHENNRYKRLKAVCEDIPIPNTKISVPQYKIVYHGHPYALPAFKRVMLRNNCWIEDDDEFAKVLENELWKSYHYQEDEVNALEARFAQTSLNDKTEEDKQEEVKHEENKKAEESPINQPEEHTPEQIAQRKIYKAGRLPVPESSQEERIPSKAKPKPKARGRPRKNKTTRKSQASLIEC